MKFSKDDQNTFLLVAAILVVCIIAIVVMVGLIWGIIAKPVGETVSSVANFLNQKPEAPLNYNFKIPAAPVVEASPQPQAQDSSDQNAQPQKYELPYRDAQILGVSTQSISQDPLVIETTKYRYATSNDLTQTKFNVKIDAIGMNAPAMHGSDVEFILQSGFLIYPGSDLSMDGSIILVCYRTQFKSSDPKSCWYLDKLQKDDEIIIDNFGSETKYKIIGTNYLNFSGDFLYQKSAEDKYLQIVTNDGNNRIVILAERQ